MGTGYNPRIVTENLVFCVDAANIRSYPKTGTTWTDLKGGNNGTLTNMDAANFSSNNGGSLSFDGAGDYIQLGSGASAKFHKVLEDTDTDGSGNATLTIFPDLRSSPADDATVVVTNAKGVFRLSDNLINWNVDEASVYGITFGCAESL